MTQISTKSVLEAIKDIQQSKVDNKICPVFASSHDLIKRFGLIPHVTLKALIDSGKIETKDAMHCQYYQVI